jgi:hypothetical protein
MDRSTSEKLADILRNVKALPPDAQQDLVAEFEDRVAQLTTSALSASQKAEVSSRLLHSRRHVADDDVHRVLKAYNPGS